MLSELRREKITRLFRLMDADGNGLMEKSDLDRIAGELAETRGWGPESEGARALQAGHEGMWRQVEAFADEGEVTLDAFVAYHEQMLPRPGAYDETIGPLSKLIFSTLDADGDGRITLEEHRTFYRIYRVDPSLADTVFPMWDTDENGFVSTQELAEAVRQFFYSDDPESPGNWLFGPLSSDMPQSRVDA